ncbi:MAG: ribonuclease catalytic domain-containing protein [Pseudomonadota bacterium]
MSEFEGSIWAVPEGDTLTLACVSKRVKKKAHILNEKNREQNLNEDKLLWTLADKISAPGDWPDKLNSIQTNLQALKDDLDISLLWETAQEMDCTDIAELTELYFGDDVEKLHQIAIWQALAEEKLHFKRRGQQWEIRPAAQIEELQLQRQREQEKTELQSNAQSWLEQAVKNIDKLEQTAEVETFVERLDCWFRGDHDKDVQTLIGKAAEETHQSPRELSFDILQQVGRLPGNADRDVIVAGLKPEFSIPITEAAEGVQSWSPPSDAAEITLHFSIDDDDTREVDDALAIERDGEHWKITVAIADPARLIHLDDALDREAMRRGTTVYLPTQTVLMVPSRVSCDLASLNADELRSSVFAHIWLDDNAKLQRYEIGRAPVRVAKRLSYDDADQMIAGGGDENAQRLQNLQQLSDKLLAERVAEGALNMQRPEYKIRVENAYTDEVQVHVAVLERNSPSRLMIAEMMILINNIAARYAQSHEVPIIYRTQAEPVEPIEADFENDPIAFHKVRRLLKPSALSLHPGGHSGLGLPVYTQFSSPLRRFADLVMQRQLVAHISDEPLPYDHEELFKVLATAEQSARDARSTEAAAKKRWFTHYLKQSHQDETLEALVVENGKAGCKVELIPWGADALLGTPHKMKPGQRVEAKIEKLRPKAGSIRLRLA